MSNEKKDSVTVNEEAPLALCTENMETYNYWLAGYIYYDDALLAEITKASADGIMLTSSSTMIH